MSFFLQTFIYLLYIHYVTDKAEPRQKQQQQLFPNASWSTTRSCRRYVATMICKWMWVIMFLCFRMCVVSVFVCECCTSPIVKSWHRWCCQFDSSSIHPSLARTLQSSLNCRKRWKKKRTRGVRLMDMCLLCCCECFVSPIHPASLLLLLVRWQLHPLPPP